MATEPEIKTRRVPVQAFRVHWMCASGCGGEMRYTGNGMGLAFGTQWEHACNVCGRKEWREGESYPRIEYEELGT